MAGRNILVKVDAAALQRDGALKQIHLQYISENDLPMYYRLSNSSVSYKVEYDSGQATLRIVLKPDAPSHELREYDELGLPRQTSKQAELYADIAETTGIDPRREAIYSRRSASFGVKDIASSYCVFGLGDPRDILPSPHTRRTSEEIRERREKFEARDYRRRDSSAGKSGRNSKGKPRP